MADVGTLAHAQEMLAAWCSAETAVMAGQEYWVGTLRVRRADLDMIGNRVTFWKREVARLTAAARRRRRGIIRPIVQM